MGADGPMVMAFVSISLGRHKALTEGAQPLPQPVKIHALIDTGASCTCVDPQVLTDLGLSPTGSTPVVTVGGTPEDRDQYDVGLAIPGASQDDAFLVFHTIPVIAAPLFAVQGFHALIGRDILGRCVLNYNGSLQQFTLAY